MSPYTWSRYRGASCAVSRYGPTGMSFWVAPGCVGYCNGCDVDGRMRSLSQSVFRIQTLPSMSIVRLGQPDSSSA